MSDQAEQETDVKPRANKIVLAIGVGMVVVLAAGIYFAFAFVEGERSRNLQAWQVRLGIVADGRAAAVGEWVDENYATLRELTENASLQLYMTELALGGGDREEITDEAAQATFLRNLLIATADRTGFVPPAGAGEVSANVEKVGVAGIGLVDANGQPIVSSPGMPPISGKIRKAAAAALDGEPSLIDLYMGAGNQPTIGFALPVYSVQGDETKGIGAVIAIRIVGADLFKRLKQPGDTSETTETYLVRKSGGSVEYLSPLADDTPPLGRSLAADTAELAAAYALEKPGGFSIKRDYAGNDALVTSRPVGNLPWVLIRKISRAEALSGSETRLQTILVVFVLIIIGVGITVIAVWRHGSSIRATEAADKFRIAAERFGNMSKFMRVVTNSQPTHIIAVSGETKYTFANEPAGRDAGLTADEMLGKTMASVIGPVPAEAYAKINTKILSDFATLENQGDEGSVEKCRHVEMHTFGEDDDIEVIRSSHVPLRGDRDHPPGVLMVLDDLTELTTERRRSEQMTRQLINTLVNVVDRRDVFSADRSSRIAAVARAIAKEMGADRDIIDTVDIAGNLASLGRIFISTDILSKEDDDLSDTEREMLKQVHMVSAGLLKDVPFDGPVIETIRQSGEQPDGGGPLGLEGENILGTSRIVSVATAFVNLISPRRGKSGDPIDTVTDKILHRSGSGYDRGCISALINYLENRGGKVEWAGFSDPPPNA